MTTCGRPARGRTYMNRGAGAVLCILLAMPGCTAPVAERSVAAPRQIDYVYTQMGRLLTEVLLDASTGQSRWSKVDVIGVMAESHDREFVPALLDVLLDDKCESLHGPAAAALGEIGDSAVFEPLKEAVASGRLTTAQGVWAMGRLAVKSRDKEIRGYVLKSLSSSADEEVRMAALGSLRLNSTGMSPVVARALEQSARSDKSIDVRIEAAGWLVSSGRQEFVSVLKEAVASPETGVRRHVVWTIVFSDQTMPLLLQLLADEDHQVAEAAWERLSKELGEVNYASPPTSVQQGREMAEAYRKAWNASHRK